MSSKDIWPEIFKLLDKDLRKLRDSFQKTVNSVVNIRVQFDDIGLKVSKFIENNRSEIENSFGVLLDKNFIENFFSKYLTDIHKKLIEHGYFVGLAGWGLSYTNELKKLLDKDCKDEIEEYLLSLLRDKKNMIDIAQKWDNNIYFKNRIKFLRRGLKAHSEKDYIVSIPVLLPHIEAILAEFFVEKELLSEAPDKFQGNDALKILKTITVDELCTEIDKIHFRRFVDQKGVYDFRDDSSYLNRGKILHGTCLKYDREDWSAQVIYFLDFLCDFLTKDWSLTTNDNGARILKKD